MNTPTYAAPDATATSGAGPDPSARHRTLYRPASDRMLAGVASGLARHFDLDVTLVRIALVVLSFIGGIGLPFYLACWLLIPAEGAADSVASEFVHTFEGWRN